MRQGKCGRQAGALDTVVIQQRRQNGEGGYCEECTKKSCTSQGRRIVAWALAMYLRASHGVHSPTHAGRLLRPNITTLQSKHGIKIRALSLVRTYRNCRRVTYYIDLCRFGEHRTSHVTFSNDPPPNSTKVRSERPRSVAVDDLDRFVR